MEFTTYPSFSHVRRTASSSSSSNMLVSSVSTSHSHGQNHERKATAGVRFCACLFAAVLVFSSLMTPISARTIAYCSDVNTGENYDPMISEFQSHGLCYDNCNKADYAFAIVQGSNCWCSNYVPGNEASASSCSQQCPGFPEELCGNTSENLYGYMSLPRKPSGTKGAETTTSATSTTSTTSTTPTTFKTSSKTTATAGVTVTVGGTTTTSTPTSPAESANSSNDSFFSNTGRTAGLIVGLILALFFIVAAVFFWRRRRQQLHTSLYGSDSHASGVIPAGGAGVFGNRRNRTRSMSTLGLVGEKGMNSPTAAGPAPTPHTAGGTTPQVGTAYDQRLDPSSLFMRFDHQTGSSRMSVRSLRDDQDYSRRVLRLANPDD